MTPWQMVAEEPINLPCAQPPKGYAPLLEPLTEVFHDFDMEPNRRTGVALCEQILDEGCENYGKVVPRYTPTRSGALEDLLDRGGTEKTQRFQCSATLPPTPRACQFQSKTGLRLPFTFA